MVFFVRLDICMDMKEENEIELNYGKLRARFEMVSVWKIRSASGIRFDDHFNDDILRCNYN